MCRGALQYFDALNHRRCNRQVQRIVPRVEVAHTHAVEQHKDLVERAAAHTDVGLCTVSSPCPHIQPRQVLQDIRHGQ